MSGLRGSRWVTARVRLSEAASPYLILVRRWTVVLGPWSGVFVSFVSFCGVLSGPDSTEGNEGNEEIHFCAAVDSVGILSKQEEAHGVRSLDSGFTGSVLPLLRSAAGV